MCEPANESTVRRKRQYDKTYACTIPGCERPARHRGWCARHYQRWQRHGSPLRGGRFQRPHGLSLEGLVEWELSTAHHDGDCLVANHPTNHAGYALVSFGGKSYRLHRLVLEHRIGRTLERHEHACHRCHQPRCINPDHLYVDSQAGNMADMRRAGRGRSGQRSGAANSSARLTESDVASIRQRAADGVAQRSIAAEFGVGQATISRVVRRETYA